MQCLARHCLSLPCPPLPLSPLSTTASLSLLPRTGLQSEAAKDEWKGALPPVTVTTSRDDSSEDNNSEEEGEGEGEGEGNGEGEEGEEEEQQSVASGWNIIIATTVWLRVLGVLGDVSHLPHPIHREEALRHIQKTWILLEKVERGEGKGGKERGGEGRGGRVGGVEGKQCFVQQTLNASLLRALV